MRSTKNLAVFVAAASVILGSLIINTPLLAAASEKVLYSFCTAPGCIDGILPNDLISDESGNLYGMTQLGGAYGSGVVFELIPKDGKWKEKVLHSFNPNSKDGFYPQGGLVFDKAGNLYGTTSQGGANNCDGDSCGTVFELIPNNGKWSEKVLHSFNFDCNGYNPYATLILDSAGNLYGTTNESCTTIRSGIVFELIRNNGRWTEKVLYNFPNDNAFPDHDLIFDKAGNLYGTTIGGGTSGNGTVFELTPSRGKWAEKVLYSFDDIITTRSRLIFDKAGNLYGTTSEGGSPTCVDGCGYFFELTPGKNGKWTETVVHNFINNGHDGYNPIAGLILDSAENLYSTTSAGGAVSVCVDFGGCGTVFELIPGKNGTWTEKILHSFELNSKDGIIPYTGLIFSKTGNLYGSTSSGGTSTVGCGTGGPGCGTVFEVTP
jgi:uncharacterized repeat protein (TIGR03803 family)